MSLEETIARKFADAARVSSITGVFVGMVDGLARVNLQGSTVDIKCDGWVPPTPGDSVRVDSLNGVLRVKGPAQARSAVGEVTEALAGNTRARVTVDGQSFVLPVMAPYSPLPTDMVVINWEAGFIIGEQASPPVVEPPGSGDGGGSESFSNLLIQASDSGRYNIGGSRFGDSNVWTGTSTQGQWVYWGAFAALAGAEVSSIEIYLPLIREQNNLNIGVHNQQAMGGSAPAITSQIPAPGRAGWVTLPAVWGNFFRDNPSYGIGVVSPGGGLNQWVGRAGDAMSGALRFSGTR